VSGWWASGTGYVSLLPPSADDINDNTVSWAAGRQPQGHDTTTVHKFTRIAPYPSTDPHLEVRHLGLHIRLLLPHRSRVAQHGTTSRQTSSILLTELSCALTTHANVLSWRTIPACQLMLQQQCLCCTCGLARPPPRRASPRPGVPPRRGP